MREVARVLIFVLCIAVLLVSIAVIVYADINIVEVNITGDGTVGEAIFDGGTKLAPGTTQSGIFRIKNNSGETVVVNTLAIGNVSILDKNGNILSKGNISEDTVEKDKPPYESFTQNIIFTVDLKLLGLIPYTKTISLYEWIESPVSLFFDRISIKNGEIVEVHYRIKMREETGNNAQGVSAKTDFTVVCVGDTSGDKNIKERKQKDKDNGNTIAVQKHIHIFTDIDGHWAEDYICKLGCELHLINGFGDGTFRPDKAITRDEAIKIIVNIKGLELDDGKNLPYIDRFFLESWSKPYISTATRHKIINGYPDKRFRAKKKLSREEAVAMFVRAFYKGNQEENADLKGVFLDSENIPKWSRGYIVKAYKEKILSAFDNGKFSALSNITRAEFVSIAYRYLDSDKE